MGIYQLVFTGYFALTGYLPDGIYPVFTGYLPR